MGPVRDGFGPALRRLGRRRPVTASALVDLENPGLIVYPSGTGAAAAGRLRLLARRDGRPACFLEVDAAAVRTGEDWRRRLAGLPAPTGARPEPAAAAGAPSLSVVICTRERPQALQRCLASVVSASAGRTEIVVVDNASAGGGTRRVCRQWAEAGVRYVREPTPGLSVARNRGVREACGEWIAFTDDDVVVDPAWIDNLLARAGTGCSDCVTGLIAPAQLETRWEHYFESKVSWGRNLTDQSFAFGDQRGPLYPFSVGEVGAGANFAVSRAALLRVGEFDELLGAGRPTRGGEDLDYFFRLLQAGFRIAYEPAALVWHFHRNDRSAFRWQMFGYGAGLGAYGAKRLREPLARSAVAAHLPWALARLARLSALPGARIPARYRLLELAGIVAGSGAYLAGSLRRRARP